MIESVIIKGTGGAHVWQGLKDGGVYVQVTFDDGTYVNLDEEELKAAGVLADKGFLIRQLNRRNVSH